MVNATVPDTKAVIVAKANDVAEKMVQFSVLNELARKDATRGMLFTNKGNASSGKYRMYMDTGDNLFALMYNKVNICDWETAFDCKFGETTKKSFVKQLAPVVEKELHVRFPTHDDYSKWVQGLKEAVVNEKLDAYLGAAPVYTGKNPMANVDQLTKAIEQLQTAVNNLRQNMPSADPVAAVAVPGADGPVADAADATAADAAATDAAAPKKWSESEIAEKIDEKIKPIEAQLKDCSSDYIFHEVIIRMMRILIVLMALLFIGYATFIVYDGHNTRQAITDGGSFVVHKTMQGADLMRHSAIQACVYAIDGGIVVIDAAKFYTQLAKDGLIQYGTNMVDVGTNLARFCSATQKCIVENW